MLPAHGSQSSSSPETCPILTDASWPGSFLSSAVPHPCPTQPSANDPTLGYKTCHLLSQDGTDSVGGIQASELPVRSGWVHIVGYPALSSWPPSLSPESISSMNHLCPNPKTVFHEQHVGVPAPNPSSKLTVISLFVFANLISENGWHKILHFLITSCVNIFIYLSLISSVYILFHSVHILRLYFSWAVFFFPYWLLGALYIMDHNFVCIKYFLLISCLFFKNFMLSVALPKVILWKAYPT